MYTSDGEIKYTATNRCPHFRRGADLQRQKLERGPLCRQEMVLYLVEGEAGRGVCCF